MTKQYGFTLAEILIATLLSLLLSGMVISAFITQQKLGRQSQQQALLQQNAQFLFSLLQHELQNIGTFRRLPLVSDSLIAPANDCIVTGIDSGSFVQSEQPFIELYASVADNRAQYHCITDAETGSELLKYKRLQGMVLQRSDLRSNRYYLATNGMQWQLTDSSKAINEHIFVPYQHTVLYVALNSAQVPVLRRKRLSRNQQGSASMTTETVIEGVEKLHFQFGIDSNNDGIADYLLSSRDMTAQHWLLPVVLVRFYVLLRSLEPDPAYINQQLYMMGEQQFQAPADHYRRLLLHSSVSLHNATGVHFSLLQESSCCDHSRE